MFSDETTSVPDMSVPAERPLGELEDELASLSAHLSAGMARWLELLAEFDLRLGWKAWGGCSRWLAWRCGLDGRTARERVRVARALGGLPLIRAAFGRGELSYAKVRALTRVSAPANEDELLELAGELTAGQLERALVGGPPRRRLVCEPGAGGGAVELDLGGGWVVGVQRPAGSGGWGVVSEGARGRAGAALAGRAGRGAGRGGGVGKRFRGTACGCPGPSRVEALLAIADASLARDAERSGGDRYQVVVHVDAATLTSDAPGISVLEDGPPLAVETVRRLSCDSSLVALLEGADRPLGVGRKTRAVPPSLRRALRARDGCCRFPGCTEHPRPARTPPRALGRRRPDRAREPDPALPPPPPPRPRRRLDRRPRRPVPRPLRATRPPVPATPQGRLEKLRALNEQLDLGPHTGKHGSGEQIDLGYVSDALVRIIKRRRSKPRPRLVWTFTEYDAETRPLRPRPHRHP